MASSSPEQSFGAFVGKPISADDRRLGNALGDAVVDRFKDRDEGWLYSPNVGLAN